MAQKQHKTHQVEDAHELACILYELQQKVHIHIKLRLELVQPEVSFIASVIFCLQAGQAFVESLSVLKSKDHSFRHLID